VKRRKSPLENADRPSRASCPPARARARLSAWAAFAAAAAAATRPPGGGRCRAGHTMAWSPLALARRSSSSRSASYPARRSSAWERRTARAPGALGSSAVVGVSGRPCRGGSAACRRRRPGLQPACRRKSRRTGRSWRAAPFRGCTALAASTPAPALRQRPLPPVAASCPVGTCTAAQSCRSVRSCA